mgnify:FL=1
MRAKCAECKHLKMNGRSNGTYYSFGRGEYFCEHPEAKRLPTEAFGRKMERFVCFGTNEYETKPTIKTSPRWCPIRIPREEQK